MSLFLIKLKKKEALTQVFSYEHCKMFKNSFLYRRTTFSYCFCQFDEEATCSILGICRSLNNQKHNMGWFLLKRFVHLCRSFSLHVIGRSHSNTFLVIKMQKGTTCLKYTITARAICSDIRIL